MRVDVARDLAVSWQYLRDIVLPALMKYCPEFQCEGVELVEGTAHHKDEVRRHLDVLAGIDAYQRWLYGMRGIASRVQYTHFDSFTIRLSRPGYGGPSEYDKRLYAITHKDEGILYPYWTIQAYIDKENNDIISIGVAKTEELFLYVERLSHQIIRWHSKVRTTYSGETFIPIFWHEYEETDNYFFKFTPSMRDRQIENNSTLKSCVASILEEIDRAHSEYGHVSDDMYLMADLYDCEIGMKEADRILRERSA